MAGFGVKSSGTTKPADRVFPIGQHTAAAILAKCFCLHLERYAVLSFSPADEIGDGGRVEIPPRNGRFKTNLRRASPGYGWNRDPERSTGWLWE